MLPFIHHNYSLRINCLQTTSWLYHLSTYILFSIVVFKIYVTNVVWKYWCLYDIECQVGDFFENKLWFSFFNVQILRLKKKRLRVYEASKSYVFWMNYRTKSNSRYFGNGHFSLSTVNSNLSMCTRISSRNGFTVAS